MKSKIPYHLMTPWERTQQRIAENRRIEDNAKAIKLPTFERKTTGVSQTLLLDVVDADMAANPGKSESDSARDMARKALADNTFKGK